MIQSPGLDDLALRIADRFGSYASAGPYLLFLGEGCGHAAKVPSRLELAHEALKLLGAMDQSKSLSASPQEIFSTFETRSQSLSKSQISLMCRSIFARVAVPAFYQDLAVLVRERFFPVILTMNFDTLLEQALSRAGVRSADFRVTTFDASGTVSDQPTFDEAPLTHIVKLHGDLARDIIPVSPEQIDQLLSASRQWIKSDLRGDILMVAHQLSDDPIDRWLGHSPSRELWWIASEPPDDINKVQSWTNDLNRIVGPLGEPQRFFSQLSLRLLTPHELWEPSSESETPPSFGAETPLKDTKALSGDVSAIQSLQTEIQKTQSVLYQLDREFGAARTPQIQAQMDYQKLRVNRLEDQTRRLEPAKQSILKLAARIAEDIRRNAPSAIADVTAAAGIIDFAQSQFDTLQEEFQKGAPNQYIVSGSLGATLSVADRLLAEYGTKVVSAEVVKALAAYAPSAASKLVL